MVGTENMQRRRSESAGWVLGIALSNRTSRTGINRNNDDGYHCPLISGRNPSAVDYLMQYLQQLF